MSTEIRVTIEVGNSTEDEDHTVIRATTIETIIPASNEPDDLVPLVKAGLDRLAAENLAKAHEQTEQFAQLIRKEPR